MSSEAGLRGPAEEAAVGVGASPGADHLTVSYTLTEQDLYERFRHDMVAVPESRNILWIGYAFVLFLACVIVRFFLPLPHSVLLTGVVAVGMIPVYRWLVRRYIRKFVQAEPLQVGNGQVTISHSGVRILSSAQDVTLQWTEFERIETLRNQIRFALYGKDIILIPRRAFPSPSVADSFLKAAQDWHSSTLVSTKANPLSVTFSMSGKDLYEYRQRQRVRDPIQWMRDLAYLAIVSFIVMWIAKVSLQVILPSVLVAGLVVFGVQRAWRRLLASNEADSIAANGAITLTLSPTGILHRNRTGEVTYYWAVVTGIESLPRHIVINLSQQEAIVIPRRAFISPEAAEAFLQAAQSFYAQSWGPKRDDSTLSPHHSADT